MNSNTPFLIKGVNIQFIPGSDLANIFVGMEFEQVASRAVQKAALKAEKEGAKTPRHRGG